MLSFSLSRQQSAYFLWVLLGWFFSLAPQSLSYRLSEDRLLLSEKLRFLEKCRGDSNCLVMLLGILCLTDFKIERPHP